MDKIWLLRYVIIPIKEKSEDTKRYNWNIVESGVKYYKPNQKVIRSRQSKKERQWNGQKDKTMFYKNIQKNKDWEHK